jgi:FtsH-binding integral membrane protein
MSMWGTEAVYRDAVTVADAAVDARVAFIRRTYAHLAGAVLAFIGLEVLFFQSGFAERYAAALFSVPYGQILALVAFLVVGWIADRWAHSDTSAAMQYVGLGLYTLAEAFVFVPLLYIAREFSSPQVIPAAAVTTLCVFIGLTGIVFITRKDFSFLRTALSAASLLALGLLVCGLIFGWGGLYILFAVGMAGLAAGFVLYYTSNVLHHYRTEQHVAASLALFAAVATMFWYILQIFMSRD